jgi:iron complex outermembrane receptor protein
MISVNADAMKASGAVTSNQILEQIPQLSNAFNTNVAAPTAGNFSGFRPQIRSIPSQNIVGGSATLLLLDGQNMVGVSGLGTAPDASVIPTVVLRRVDVLPDGASATYGANALTGVINFITRDTFDGLEFGADLGVADSYSAFNASVIGGTTWEGGGAYLAAQHQENTVLMGGDRSYTRMNLTSVGGRDSRGTACPLPNIAAAGKNYAQNGYPSATPGSLAANVSGPFGAVDPVTNAGSINRCDTNVNTSIFPATNTTGIFGSFRQRIADGIEFSTKMLWNTRLQFSRIPVPFTTQTIRNTNPYFQSLAGETSQSVQFSFADYLGRSQNTFNNSVQVFQVTPQLTAALPFKDWEMVLTGNYARSSTNTFDSNGLDTAQLTTALTSGIGGKYFDPYNINLSDPTLVNNILSFKSGGTAIQRILQAQVTFDGTLFELPGGPVKLAIGGKYDWEGFYSNLNVGISKSTPYFGSHRIVESGFSELHIPVVGAGNRMPLVYSLEFDVSGRIDSYSDFGSTSNYKLGVSYRPFEEFTLRATRGTSYDAPSLADTTPNQGRYQYATYSTPNAIVPPGTSLADSLRPSILTPGANPNLKPELGSSWSIGADFRPTEHFGVDFTGLDLSITAYHLTIEHQIGLLVNNLQLFQVPSYAGLYILNPTLAQVTAYGKTLVGGFPGTDLASAFAPGVTPPYIMYDARRNNLGNSVLSGLDFSGSYTSDLDIGAFSVGLSGTVSLENTTAGSAAGPFVSIQAVAVPLYQMSGFVQLISGPWNFRTSLQYTPSFRVDPATQAFKLYNQQRVGSFATVNAHVGYDLSSLTSWTDGTELGLTLNNVLDSNPPIYLHGGTALPANGGVGIVASGSTLGRYLSMSIQKSF